MAYSPAYTWFMRASVSANTWGRWCSSNADWAIACRLDTGKQGTSWAKAMACATAVLMRMPLKAPGPRLKAIAVSCDQSIDDAVISACIIGKICWVCRRFPVRVCSATTLPAKSTNATEHWSNTLSSAKIITNCLYRLQQSCA